MKAAFMRDSLLCFAGADQDHMFDGRIQRRDGFAARARGEKTALRDPADLPAHSNPSFQKYSGSLLTQITSISLPIPAHTKGRFAIVTNVGSGCDGREVRC
jgi:hypothetical protein